MKMTMTQHFAELRRRILWCVLIFVAAFAAGWIFSPYVQQFLTIPLMRAWPDGTMLYTGVTDGLVIQFSMATLVGLIVAIPAVMWHMWAFAAPGLHTNEKRVILPILIASPALFILGVAFAFYILFPVAFKFFIELNQSSYVSYMMMPVAKDYLAFAVGLLKVFGIAFQLPLVMVLLNRLGILSLAATVSMRRYAVVLIFVLAAMLTPPDIVSQILLAVPMLVLFECGILLMPRNA